MNKKEIEKWIDDHKSVLDRIGKKETTDEDIKSFINIIEENTLNRIARECWLTSKRNGFSPHENIDDISEYKYYLSTKIALIHSEASEMLEAIRINDFDNMIEEGIDVIIRTLEYLSCLKDVDIDKQLKKKMNKNNKRTFMHGGKLL